MPHRIMRLYIAFDPYEGVLHTESGATFDREARSEVWAALADGRLEIIPRERLYVLGDAQRKPLTDMERGAALAAARAISGKEIAYSLGVAASTVSGALASAASKLGLGSRAELARLVRALMIEPANDCEAAFSDVEREVVCGILAGKSNAEIACSRGRSVHTIAKQVASILKKTNSPSRHVLRVRLGPMR